MKYAIYALLTAFLASGTYGAIPDSAEGWYTPSRFDTQDSAGTVSYFDEDGVPSMIAISVDAAGVIQDDASAYIELGLSQPAYEAMKIALQSKTIAKQNTERIETVGENLHELMSKSGISITNPQTGQSYTINFGGSIASAVSGSSGAIPATSSEEDPADNISLGWHDGRLGVSGWWSAYPGMPSSLSKLLTEGTGYVYDPARSPALLTRTPAGSVAYMPIGLLDMPRPDGRSIITNQWGLSIAGYRGAEPGAVAYKTEDGIEWKVPEQIVKTDGASIATNTEGVASLYGWSGAAAGSIPRKGAESLEWTSPADLVDGASLAWSADRKKYEVAGAGVYAGNHAKHYFGTSNDKSATLGWHELPNATTNRVEGDGITIASTAGDAPDVKVFGLRGWNRGWGGEPVFLANNGGALDYIPLSSLTNMAACACSNKWNGALAWLGGGAAIAQDGSLALPDESLDGYLYGTLGYIYSTTADNLHFDNDGEQIRASFTAPKNWADGVSVGLSDNGAYQIAGWSGAGACAANLGAMLSNPTGSDATTHLLLAKKTDTGELHYVPIGQGVSGGVKADGASIVTNVAGEAQLNGYPVAATGAMPYKTANGMGWAVSAAPAVPVLQSGAAPAMARLGSSLAQNGGVLDLAGFSAAPNLAVPQKTGDTLTWQTNFVARVAATNNIMTTSVEWLDAAGSDGNGANAYSIRIQRGRLAVNANGEIYVAQDDALTQYIHTTPHSPSMD